MASAVKMEKHAGHELGGHRQQATPEAEEASLVSFYAAKKTEEALESQKVDQEQESVTSEGSVAVQTLPQCWPGRVQHGQ